MARKSKTETDLNRLRGVIQQKIIEGQTLVDIFRNFPVILALEQIVAVFLFKDHPFGELMVETSAHTVFQAMKEAGHQDSEIFQSAVVAGHPFSRVYNFFVKVVGGEKTPREVANMCFSAEMALLEIIKGFLSVGLSGAQLFSALNFKEGSRKEVGIYASCPSYVSSNNEKFTYGFKEFVQALLDVNLCVKDIVQMFKDSQDPDVSSLVDTGLYKVLRECGISDEELIKAYLAAGVSVHNTSWAVYRHVQNGQINFIYAIFSEHGIGLAEVLSGSHDFCCNPQDLTRFIFTYKKLGYSLSDFVEAMKERNRGRLKEIDVQALRKSGYKDEELLVLL
ncbi:MAG: hypothetical protein GW775_01055 [Candidatus Magasanikbacteria bacterium]|nr:hypothetical protein [Candidatus Magasanikbacteria bacterium]